MSSYEGSSYFLDERSWHEQRHGQRGCWKTPVSFLCSLSPPKNAGGSPKSHEDDVAHVMCEGLLPAQSAKDSARPLVAKRRGDPEALLHGHSATLQELEKAFGRRRRSLSTRETGEAREVSSTRVLPWGRSIAGWHEKLSDTLKRIA